MIQHQPDLFSGLAPVAALPLCEHRLGDVPPCTFHGNGLTREQWEHATTWYNLAVEWREELGSNEPGRRFNRAVLAALLRAHSPSTGLPGYCMAAARAGIERVVWERTGHKIRLRRRVKPLRVPVPLNLSGIFQTLLL